MPSIAPEIQVACAVIWRAGQVLLSKRAVGSHQGGRWEFPGGKCEPGETPLAALIRELHEELGLEVDEATPLCQIPWDYGEKKVRLWVFEVMDFKGEPIGREGQPIAWFEPDALAELSFPEANRAIVRAVGLPRITRIFDAGIHGDPVQWVQTSGTQSLLYFRGLPPSRGLEMALDVALDLGHAVVLSPDQWPCHRPGCGAHLRKTDHLSVVVERLADLADPWPISGGLRCLEDWTRQREWPADVWFVSPVKATASHPAASPIGWEGFAELGAVVGTPVVALGGMTLNDLTAATSVFGYGVAGIRGL